MRIVIDTNVLVSAVRSKFGAAYRLVSLIPSEKFEFAVSLPLYLEYRDVLLRPDVRPKGVPDADINDFIDQILSHAEIKDISCLWRPSIRDANDEMVVDIAVAYGAEYVVTYNQKDFVGIELFGVECITPVDLLRLIGDL